MALRRAALAVGLRAASQVEGVQSGALAQQLVRPFTTASAVQAPVHIEDEPYNRCAHSMPGVRSWAIGGRGRRRAGLAAAACAAGRNGYQHCPCIQR